MPRIIQILDVDSSGHKCRMDDGEVALLPHDPACVPCVGEELTHDAETGRWSAVEGGLPHLTVERANAPAQVVANILSGTPIDSHGLPGYAEGAPERSVKQFQDDFNRDKSNLIDVKETEYELRGRSDAVEPERSSGEGPQGTEPEAAPPVG